ncbi:nitroreductase family protein [Gulosibacter sp. ACHW.36C]|uniref:Nitroreductase family protein n=1 Tax=Gulosibacter sediminis TaxID=1729695 RepID=A0ABY4N174_9MICO|nr:nitroreductase family protein [Gulosibacter sediminis]UQN14983.1 nitroreductase family protein [Gulosibacter sediminis]
MANGVLGATAMSVAAKNDPQFRLPKLPRIAPGIVIVPTNSGVLVEGGPTRQLLGGQGAQRVMSQLVPLLDGSRDLDTLAHDFGETEATTHAAVSLLYASGLLEDAHDEPAIDAAGSAAHLFYSRSIDSTRVNPSGAHALERLRASKLHLVAANNDADAALAGAIAKQLDEGGIGRVTISELGAEEATDDARIAAADLILLIGDTPALRRAAGLAVEHHVPSFPVITRGRHVYYGPVIDETYTASFAEIAGQIAAEAVTPAERDEHALVAAIVTGDVLSLRSRVGATMSKQSLMRLDLATLEQQGLVASRITRDGIPLAYAFEASTAFAPRHLSNPRDHQVHYKESNIALQRESKLWPSAPSLPLPRPAHPTVAWPELDAPADAPELPLATLTDVIVRSVGNRNLGTPLEGKVRRWAPSGGNLGSVQAYLIARRVDGLVPGVYGYDRGSDALAMLPWADPATAPAGIDPEADAVLIYTGALARVGSKYAAFSWRILHLDAGVAVHHTRMLAAAHHLESRAAGAWDDEAIADLLAIDQDAEPITAVVSLRTAPEGAES